MCGLVNKKMNTQEIVQELTQTCIQMRSMITNKFSEQKDKEAVILKHIKRFENIGTTICDFKKGNICFIIIFLRLHN